MDDQLDLITDRAAFEAIFPLPAEYSAAYTLAGRRAFVDAFSIARNAAEAEYYAQVDLNTTPGQRSRTFLAATLNPVMGRPMRDPEHFYQTFGRLMRWAWLSISAGVYDPETQAVADVAERLVLAQVGTVDTTWRPAVSRLAGRGGRGLIVEVGTGRGNSVARLATLFPEARIVSITISPEQHAIVQDVVGRLGLTNVEIRLGDIFDPTVTDDLVGQADAVGAIEVVLHFPTERKLGGMRQLTRLLSPTAPLCVMDSAIASPLNRFAERYYANQSIYFGLREQYSDLFEAAGLDPVSYVDYTPDMIQSFRESSQVLRRQRPQLRKDFGRLMSWLWPEVPARVYVPTLRNVRYVHAVATRR